MCDKYLGFYRVILVEPVKRYGLGDWLVSELRELLVDGQRHTSGHLSIDGREENKKGSLSCQLELHIGN